MFDIIGMISTVWFLSGIIELSINCPSCGTTYVLMFFNIVTLVFYGVGLWLSIELLNATKLVSSSCHIIFSINFLLRKWYEIKWDFYNILTDHCSKSIHEEGKELGITLSDFYILLFFLRLHTACTSAFPLFIILTSQ